MTIKLKNGKEVSDPRLGRIPQFDERSKNYPIRALLTQKQYKPRGYTWRVEKYLNQFDQPSCVGFSWAHELIARPCKVQNIENADGTKIYKEAQNLDEWEGSCVDEKTECASKDRGWIFWSELKVGDEILTFNINKEQLEWAVVDKIHHYDNAKFKIWSNSTFEAAVTDNHKWVVKNRNTYQPFELIETSSLKNQHTTIRSCNSLSGQPDEEKYSDDFVQMIAWVMTEGHYRSEKRRGSGVVVSQKHYKHSVAKLMEKFGVAPGFCKKDGCHVWEITGVLSKQIREVAPDRTPTMQFLLSLTKRQIKLFIDTCILGDGSILKLENRLDRRVFHQLKNKRLDTFLIACVLAGIPTHKSSYKEEQNVETWSLFQRNDVEIRSLQISDYIEGSVWCPQTKNLTFVARRNGNIWITGNSYEGSSILGGAKAVQKFGYITEYRWAFSLSDLILAVGYKGPVVLGINWYENMFDADSSGFIHPTGEWCGGHAILCYRVSVKLQEFSLWNSWSRDWGVNGTCKVKFNDVEKLLSEEGEACIPVGRLKPKK